MKSVLAWVWFVIAMMCAQIAAAKSQLQFYCEGNDANAEIYINGKLVGDCPYDVKVDPGTYQIRVVKPAGQDKERVFEQTVHLGDDGRKKIEIILGAPQWTAAWLRQEQDRKAAEQARLQREREEKTRLEQERLAAEQARLQKEREEKAKLEQERLAAEQARLQQEREESTKRDLVVEQAFNVHAKEAAGIQAAALLDFKNKGIEPGNGKSFRDCDVCPEMVLVPAGMLYFGVNEDLHGEVKPKHLVGIGYVFAVGKFEVTQKEWVALMGKNPSHNASFIKNTDDYPVDSITWLEMQEFLKRLSQKTGQTYRLLSEAEWIWSCWSKKPAQHCGGDDADAVSWNYDNTRDHDYGENDAHPVGMKQANAFGLYDMSGNVSEALQDAYHNNYHGAPTDGSAWMDKAKDVDYPDSKVRRGGAAKDAPPHMFWRKENIYKNVETGFRVARNVVRTVP